MNDDQQQIIKTIVQAINATESNQSPSCKALFLDGPGGSGKTSTNLNLTLQASWY